MKITNTFLYKTLLTLTAASTLLFASCELFGLGDAVDLTAPTVAISTPESMENVSSDFVITGTASDDTSVTSLQVNLTTTGQSWKYESGSWLYKSSSSADWASYSNSNCVWTAGEDKTVSWALGVSAASSADITNYSITAIAYDAAENSGSSSSATIVLVIDTTPPVLTVNEPELTTALSMAGAETKMSTWSVKNGACLSYLLNSSFTISGNTTDDATLKSIEINFQNDDGSTIYCTKTITGTETELRNWSATVSAFDLNNVNDDSEKTIMKVFTICIDEAGNKEKVTQGYVCWLPDADIPWAVVPFGESTLADASSAYPGYSLNGQAYDDDGLDSISYSITDTGNSTVVDSGKIDLSSTYPTYSIWSVTTPSKTGTYSILITCKDKNGKSSESVTKYISVTDVSIPVISFDDSVSSITALGDSNGDITFTGKITDDGNSFSLQMVRIKPGDNYLTSQVNFLNGSYAGWNSASESGTSYGSGNIVYTISTETPALSGSSYSAAFTKTVNIFDYIGSDGSTETLGSQLFLFRASDGTNVSVVTKSLAGDTEAPVLSIKTIKINSDDPIELSNSATLGSIYSTDSIVISGTWSDNSTTNWNSTDKIGDVLFTLNGVSYSTEKSSDGTWKTDSITGLTATSYNVSASISDYAKNKASASIGFFTEASIPNLVSISTTSPDGSYMANDVITLALVFNKAVTASSTNTFLVLSNGKSASYSSGNGTSVHYYTYTVASGDTNTTDLDVSSISASGITWTDSSNQTTNMTMPSGSNSLAGAHDITVDTVAPTISGIKALTSSGSYNAGNSIFIQVTFSEDVSIDDSSKISLSVNSTTSKVTSPTKTGSNTLLFNYKIASGDTASLLSVTGLSSTATIIDAAGNNASTSISSTALTGIIIDTTAPSAPTIRLSAGTYYGSKSFTVAGEDGATIEYSVDGGSSWEAGTSATLSLTGSYTLTARQTDVAGNVSAQTTNVLVKIDNDGNLITGITSTLSNGTYTTGKEIPVVVNFRKAVTVTGTPTLALVDSGTSDKAVGSATYTSGSGTSSLTFKYTVANGDSVSELNVSSISFDSATIKDSSENSLNSVISTQPISGFFKEARSIAIITGVPAVSSFSQTGEDSAAVLSITFDRNIYKGSGNVVLTYDSTTSKYAPAVLSSSEYSSMGSAIQAYYAEGTNGSSSTGTADLTSKYVLDYKYNNSNETLVGLLNTAKYYTVTIPVTSSAVTINGKIMTIALTGSYAIPVKGAKYSCTIPASLVSDELGNTNKADETNSFTAIGVEEPTIRINKSQETISSDTATDDSKNVATQPFTADVKIDCQTPGATVKYATSSVVYDVYTVSTKEFPSSGTAKAIPTLAEQNTNTLTAATPSSEYSSSFTIGASSSDADVYKGAKYLISANATANSTTSGTSYETAYRTVLQFNYDGATGTYLNSTVDSKAYTSFWVRGGDSVTGGVTTPDFPFSWDVAETSKVRLMTNEDPSDTNNKKWYLISWKVTTTAYIGFLTGNVPDDASTYGPSAWCWGACAWVGYKSYYPLYPGSSLLMPAKDFGQIAGQTRGPYEFKFSGLGSR